MTRRLPLLLIATASVLGACGKKSSKRAEIVECSNISLDAKGTTQCLVQLYHWKVADAQRAANERAYEMDSIKTWKEDSVWQLDNNGPRRCQIDAAGTRRIKIETDSVGAGTSR